MRDRHGTDRGALGVVVVGTLLGTVTGGALGALTIAVVALASGGFDPSWGGQSGAVLLGVLAFGYGAVVGAVDSVVVALVLAATRPMIAGDPWRARGVAAVTATLPVAVVGGWQDLPTLPVLGFALVCAAGAGLWSRLVLGLPRATSRSPRLSP